MLVLTIYKNAGENNLIAQKKILRYEFLTK